MHLIKKKIKVVGECHIWTGAVKKDYPRIGRDGDYNKRGHRYVYEQTHGVALTEEQVVRHKCDNPLCLNPNHLLIGTVQDNIDDRNKRGRTHGHVSDVEKQDVLALRETGMYMKDIAINLNIKFKRVEYILNL